jgi:predicted dehydrogenase
MADQLNWGILACGSIANRFADGLKKSKTGTLVACGSRSLEKAQAFAEKHGGKGYGSYEEVLRDPEVHAVYIATPHQLHAAWTIEAAKAGKAILCEKPFTLNAVEAEHALQAVKEHSVFFMEAFMYRCAPQTLLAKKWVQEGRIGKPLVVEANFGFQADEDWANFRTENAHGGGGLMDVGTYCVSFMRWILGEEPSRAAYMTPLNEKGYDGHGAGSLQFPGGAVGHFGTGIHVNLRNDATIYGTEGKIEITSPWFATSSRMTLTRRDGENETQEWNGELDLYALEADAVAEYLDAKEAPYMTIADTLGNMVALDALRASANFRFEGERTR